LSRVRARKYHFAHGRKLNPDTTAASARPARSIEIGPFRSPDVVSVKVPIYFIRAPVRKQYRKIGIGIARVL
jgi:hypothetical protein